MGQSSNELCGHDRGQLRTVLKWAASDDARGKSHEPCDCGGPYCVINNDLIDPAKLAKMLASEGRRLGIYTIRCDHIGGNEINLAIGYAEDGDSRELTFVPAQARSILRAWLELQDGSHEEAEKALRGGM